MLVMVMMKHVANCSEAVERVMGIEPTQPAWKAGALPLSYTRTTPSALPELQGNGGGGRIRTYVDYRRQIYSLLPLTTRPPLQGDQTAMRGGRQELLATHQLVNGKISFSPPFPSLTNFLGVDEGTG